jgi:hypothetical protein
MNSTPKNVGPGEQAERGNCRLSHVPNSKRVTCLDALVEPSLGIVAPGIVSAAEKLDAWIEAEEFKGWDPHDALNSPLLRWAGRQRFLGIAFLQLLRRNPLNLRPVLGIRKGYNPKGMGLFLAAYAQKFAATGQNEHLQETRFFFNWLVHNSSQGYSGSCWGYNFDWPNRAFLAPAGTPTIVNTAFIGLAFLCAHSLQRPWENGVEADEACESWDEQKSEPWRSVEGLVVARSACEFILQDLHTTRPSADELCFSYTPLDHRFVHNANMLGAWLLAAVYDHTGEGNLAEAALAAARFTARRQCPDGSWPYGVASSDRWVDNFHTGYVLVALKRIAAYLKTREFDSALETGYEFWRTRMFQSGDIPRYYSNETFPIDVHSISQAILTFLEFAGYDCEARRRAERVAIWAVRNMQDPKGFFYYQLRRHFQIRIPYMRWAQAWMQQAFMSLCSGQWLNISKVQQHANLD